MLQDAIEKTKEELEKGINSLTRGRDNVVQGARNSVSSLKDSGQRRLAETVTQFEDTVPIFAKAGFLLERIEVDVGFTPKVIPHFALSGEASEADRQAALKELKSHRTSRMVMESLIKATALQRFLQGGSMDFVGLEVHMGAMPTVRLKFKVRNESEEERLEAAKQRKIQGLEKLREQLKEASSKRQE